MASSIQVDESLFDRTHLSGVEFGREQAHVPEFVQDEDVGHSRCGTDDVRCSAEPHELQVSWLFCWSK